MKKIRSAGKAALSLLLCCVMLSCTTFAAGPVEVCHLGNGITVTFGGKAPDIEPYAAKKVDLISMSVNCGNSYTIIPPVTTRAEDGSRLSLRVDSTGGTDVEVKCTLTMSNGEKITRSNVIAPPNYFLVEVSNNNGAGLVCTVDVQVRAFQSGETGTAFIYMKQW